MPSGYHHLTYPERCPDLRLEEKWIFDPCDCAGAEPEPYDNCAGVAPQQRPSGVSSCAGRTYGAGAQGSADGGPPRDLGNA